MNTDGTGAPNAQQNTPAAPSVLQFMQSLAQSNEAVTQLLSQVVAQRAAAASKSIIARPESFDGKKGPSDARRYVQYFLLWATNQNMDEETLTRAFISGLTGDAAQWAAPYLIEIEKHQQDPTQHAFPFGGSFTDFKEAFKLRFQATDDHGEAIREMDRLTQGPKQTVAEYAALFQQISPRTTLGPVDLMERFQKGLNADAKARLTLAMIARDKKDHPTTLERLVRLAVDTDNAFRIHNTDFSRMLSTASARQPPRDPWAMDIDATRVSRPTPSGRTVEDFRKQMRGRCYGCGSTGHLKTACSFAHTQCNYCKRLGHKDAVCQDRFLGYSEGRGLSSNRPKQRVAATSEFSLFGNPASSSTTNEPSPAPASSSLETTIALLQNQLAAQQQLFQQLSTSAGQSF